MKTKRYLSAFIGLGLAAGLATSAFAEDNAARKGLYLFGQAGVNWLKNSDASGPGISSDLDFDHGPAAAVGVGYGYGNGVRTEAEFGYRKNDLDSVGSVSGSGDVKTLSLMLNALYDFNVFGGSVIPYIGAGLGGARIDADGLGTIGGSSTGDSDTVFAWQLLAGVAVPLTDNLDLTFDYRYFRPNDAHFTLNSGTEINVDGTDHTALVGVRWRFGAPAPAPMPAAAPAAPPPAPAPAPKPAPAPAPKPEAAPAPAPAPVPRDYLVFFDWNKAVIRSDAQSVIEVAAANAKKVGYSRIRLVGHADRSGPASYNLRLSERRALAVKAALVKLGIRADEITTVGRGESEPLVPTADGVREPRNRRVEISF